MKSRHPIRRVAGPRGALLRGALWRGRLSFGTAGLWAMAGAWALAGCQSARVAEPLTRKLGGNDPDQQMEFLHELADRKIASNDDGFHAVLLFIDGQDPAGNYSDRVAAPRRRKMLPGGFDEPAGHALERGTLAVALARRCRSEVG